MKIRTLFSLFTISIIIFMSAVGAWQFRDGRAKVQAVSWLERSNELVGGIHRASGELAVERGLTAGLLAQLSVGSATDKSWSSVQIQQNLVDSHLQNVIGLLDQLIAIHPSAALINYQQQLYTQLDILSHHRQQVGNLAAGLAADTNTQLWIEEVTAIVEVLHSIASVSVLPIEDNIYSYASHPVVQDVLFTLSEYLGRQRAIIAAMLADEQPISAKDIKKLEAYHSISQESYQRFLIFTKHLSLNNNLTQANALPEDNNLSPEIEYLQQQMQAFVALRNSIVNQSISGQAYSVSVDEWFEQATTTIQSVQQSSYKISEQHELRISMLRKNAEHAQWLALMLFIFFIVGFAVAARMLRKRILTPLHKLRIAADQIALDNLESTFERCCEDEVGVLGQAFESMRLQLLQDKELRLLHEQERKKLYTAIEQSIVAIIITDQQGNVEYVNQPYMKASGYEAEEIVGQKIDILRSKAKSIGYYQELKDNLNSGKAWTGELLNKRKSGSLYWALASISPVFNELGEITHYIDIHLDISESKRVAQRLNFISYYDQTTSLPNRQYLSRHFEKIRKKINSNELVALVSLTIGKLKQINDSLGWHVGDQVLREVGMRLKQQVNINDLVAHQEGGKFIILVLSAKNTYELNLQVNKKVSALSQPIVVQQQTVQLNPRAGVSVYTDGCRSFESLLKQSNIALHQSELSAVNPIHFFDDEMDINAKHKMQLESALSAAIKNNELELYYQPKVNLRTGAVDSVEALLRWYDQEKNEFISPDLFISIAEGSGLIYSLGDWVLEQACQQLLRWNQEQQLFLVVAVNLSVEQLKQPTFLTNIEAILKKTGVSAEQIEFELTESVLMENPEQTMDLLISLKNMGFKLSIDDFGTGYSSLFYLSRLPVDYLKIDRSFIENITSDLSAAAIATSIIDLGHRMGLKVVAEGVETAEQLEYLSQNKCDYMQGFYYSKALPAQQLYELLTDSSSRAVVEQR